MLKRVKKRHKGRQAFTLVELLVVLVILAVLAAAIVPVLTGYIKRAKRDKNDEAAHYALVACQSVIVEYYGKGNIATNGTVNQQGQQGGGGSGGDLRWDESDGANNTAEDVEWGNKVLALFDRDRSTEPYILVFGTGRANSVEDTSDAYKVYYIAYVETKDSPAIFYINGEWRYEYPTDSPAVMRKSNNINYIITNDGIPNNDIPIQYYVVSQNTGIKDNFWTSSDPRSLKSHSAGHNGY